MTEQQPDRRLDAVLEMLMSIASLDFSSRLTITNNVDSIDAIASGLNMLSEELEGNVVEISKLEEVNGNLERFACVVAHDMKTPLGNAISISNLLEDELKDHHNKEVLEYIELLRQTNKQMSHLISGVLEYSRTSFANLQPQEVDLGKLCREIAAQYRSNKQIAINIADKMPVIKYHETALTQIINNLIDNAVKYNDKEICQIEVQCAYQNDQYVISVADNGPGVLPEYREKIFDLFENLNTEKENSTGIGLATIKKIVTDTNGRIWVESSENQGARFVFTIKKRD